MPLQRISRSSVPNRASGRPSQGGYPSTCARPTSSQPLWYRDCVATLSVSGELIARHRGYQYIWFYSWNEVPGYDSASRAVEVREDILVNSKLASNASAHVF